MAKSRAVLQAVFVGMRRSQVVFVGQARPADPTIDQPVLSAVPADYAEFIKLFGDKIRNQVAGFVGIDPNEVEDISQTIQLQFIKGRYLNIYSAEKQGKFAEARYRKSLAEYEAGLLDTPPERFSGKFSSFVFEFTKRRLFGIREKANRRTKVMRPLDIQVEDSEDGAETSVLLHVGKHDDMYLTIILRQVIQEAYKYLVSVTKPTATRNFPELFWTVVNDTFNNAEGFDRAAYAQKKGITISAVSMQMREIKLLLEQSGLYKNLKQLARGRYSGLF